MPDEWSLESLLKLDGPVTPEMIRELRKSGADLVAKARAIQKLGEAKLKMAQDLCDHPRKVGYVCPDCGYDTGPDPY